MNTLTDKEKRALRFRGYTNADMDQMTDEEAQLILTTKTVKPGSKRAAAAVATAIGMPGVPAHYTNEGEAARVEGKAVSNVRVITDEYTQQLNSGVNLNDEVAGPYVRGNPDKAFRILTPTVMKHRGKRGWQPVYDEQGKAVSVLNQDRILAWKPKEVRDRNLQSYREQSQAARVSASEHMIEMGEKTARDTGGQIRAMKNGEIVGGVPIGVTSTRGHQVTD